MRSFVQGLIFLLQRSNVSCNGFIRISKIVQVTHPFQRLVKRVLATRFKRSPQGAFTAILRHRLQEPWNFIESIGARQIVLSDCDNPATTMTVSDVGILKEFKHIVSFCTRLQPNERYGSVLRATIASMQPSHDRVTRTRRTVLAHCSAKAGYVLGDQGACFQHLWDVQEPSDNQDVLHRERLGGLDDPLSALHQEREPTGSIGASHHRSYHYHRSARFQRLFVHG